MSAHVTGFVLVIAVALLGPLAASAADAPSKAVTDAARPSVGAVSYASGTEQVTGYLALPAASDTRRPALIVIHEWWGFTDWVEDAVTRFAGEGYVALGIDLYRGHSAGDASEAHELMRGLPEDRALRDLTAAFDYLRSRPDVDPDRIGSIGWCMGGGFSLVAALNLPELKAAVVCYGRLAEDPTALENIQADMLGIFGGSDRGITAESVREFERTM